MEQDQVQDHSISMQGANMFGLMFFPVSALLAFAPFVLLHGWIALRDGLFAVFSPWVFFPGLIVLVVVHEGLHALGFLASGVVRRDHLRFGIDKKTLSPYAGCTAPMPARAYRVSGSLPGFVLGILPVVVGFLSGSGTFVAAGWFMTAAAGGDLAALWAMRRVPGDVWVEDHPSRVGCRTVPAPARVATVVMLLAVTLAVSGSVCAPLAAQGTDSHEPVILVHYMPWYQAKPHSGAWGWHWTMNHFDPDRVDADGKRQIASHYYPVIGPYDSRDPNVLEYHTLLMKVAGIDGVVVDWYGTSDLFDYPPLHEGSILLFDAARRNGLKFAICYEDQTVGHLISAGRLSPASAIAHGREEMAYVHRTWMQEPEYVKIDGRPVLLNFGPQFYATSAEWEALFESLEPPPLFFTLDARLDPVAAGAFAWPPMRGSTVTTFSLRNYLNLFYARGQTEWPSYVGGAFPGFHDIYEEAGVGASYGFLDARDGQTFEETLERALAADAPIIQIVTWNDFGEGTNIEPAEEYGYRYLERLQQNVHTLRSLAYDVDDLRLPHAILSLRRAAGTDAAVAAELDAATELLAGGNPSQARAIVDRLATSSETGAPQQATSVGVYPNPSSGAATVQVQLASAGAVVLTVYDATGRAVRQIANGMMGQGPHRFTLDASYLPSGTYFLRSHVDGRGDTIPFVIL